MHFGKSTIDSGISNSSVRASLFPRRKKIDRKPWIDERGIRDLGIGRTDGSVISGRKTVRISIILRRIRHAYPGGDAISLPGCIIGRELFPRGGGRRCDIFQSGQYRRHGPRHVKNHRRRFVSGYTYTPGQFTS